jgi:hypothetical protein|tara:strand:- start:1419 stop:1544 length:126 start_codon:yes stop_codon:yes gene_type:complete
MQNNDNVNKIDRLTDLNEEMQVLIEQERNDIQGEQQRIESA